LVLFFVFGFGFGFVFCFGFVLFFVGCCGNSVVGRILEVKDFWKDFLLGEKRREERGGEERRGEERREERVEEREGGRKIWRNGEFAEIGKWVVSEE